MNVPKVDIKQLLEAGVHLGHKTLRWNPKMKKYIFGEKNSIHIIDLTQTVDFLNCLYIPGPNFAHSYKGIALPVQNFGITVVD